MKAYSRFNRNFVRAVLFMLVCLVLFAVKVSAQETSFSIIGFSRNEHNTSVVAVRVFGAFQENDVINIFSNDSFITAKVIGADDVTEGGEVIVDNISTDVFVTGVNNVVAKLARNGATLQETEPFELTIVGVPAQPSIIVEPESADADAPADSYSIAVSGNFLTGDSVSVFLNDSEIRMRVVTPEEVTGNSVSFPSISADELAVGENHFAAVIRRGSHESQRGTLAEPIIIAVPKSVEKPPVKATVTAQEDEAAEMLYECVTYTMTQKLVPENPERKTQLGENVSINRDTLVSGTGIHKAYLYTDNGSSWKPSGTVVEQEYRSTGTRRMVAVSDGQDVIVGVPKAHHGGHQSGSVYVYRRSDSSLLFRSALLSATTAPYDLFGRSIAVDGNTLAIGAEGRDKSGYVYVYTRRNDQWVRSVRLTASDTARGQQFGAGIAIDGDVIAIGAPGDLISGADAGAVYVYAFDGSRWNEKKIVPPDTDSEGTFGSEILFGDGNLFVGAAQKGRGAVYVYTRQGDLWQLQQEITPPENGFSQHFGTSLAYSNGVLVVGAPGAEDENGDRTGLVYTYTHGDAEWTLRKTTSGEMVKSGDRFGTSVAFDGRHLVVGAPQHDTAERDTGALYIYDSIPVTCSSEETTSESAAGSQAESVDTLSERKTILESLTERINALIADVDAKLRSAADDAEKKDERLVIFDEATVHADAQRRAAELRGLTAPRLPGEVVVERVVTADEEQSADEDQEVSRSRDEVVEETRENLGVVVPTGSDELRIGDTDEEVYRLQVFLNNNGYTVSRSGAGSPGNEVNTFGSSTERALRSFQRVNGVPVTGVLDRRTRDMILTYVSSF